MADVTLTEDGREALRERIETAIALDFEGRGEAWPGGDAMAYYASVAAERIATARVQQAEATLSQMMRALPHDWKEQYQRAEAAEAQTAALIARVQALADELRYEAGRRDRTYLYNAQVRDAFRKYAQRLLDATDTTALDKALAKAWDEGASEGIRMHDQHKAWMLTNPYRRAGESDE